MNTPPLLTGLALIGLAILAYLLIRPTDPVGDAPVPSATVSAIALTQSDVPRHVSAWGSIVAGQAEMDIALTAPGIVTGFLVRPGQGVEAGQALAQVARALPLARIVVYGPQESARPAHLPPQVQLFAGHFWPGRQGNRQNLPQVMVRPTATQAKWPHAASLLLPHLDPLLRCRTPRS